MATSPEKMMIDAPQQSGPDMEVLGTIEKSKGGGKKPQMSTVEILTEEAKRAGVDPNQLMAKLGMMKQDPNVKTVQIGNTVFLLIQVKPETVEVHSFTAENPQGLMENFKSLTMFLKKNGMKSGYTYSDQPAFKRLAESSGLPVKVSQSVKKMGGQMKPVYMYTMEF